MPGVSIVLKSMVLVRKAASQTEQRGSITLSPSPESLDVHDQLQKPTRNL